MKTNYECNVCGESSCKFSVIEEGIEPSICPFNADTNANWKKIDLNKKKNKSKDVEENKANFYQSELNLF